MAMDPPAEPMTRYPPTSWPDPEPAPGRPKCDDVTRLNATEVEAVYCVRSRADVQRVLALARAAGRTVSMRGACHTMGGQTLTPGGIVIDMGKLAHMELDRDSGLLIVGPGALWSDVLLYLNQYGRSPRTMQSYSTFSVGGSISVNAHGITSDCCMAECVVSLELVGWDGRVHTCGRDAATAEDRELFGAVIGGYGMFGVMTSVTLKTSVNTPLTMEHVLTTSAEEFARVYSSLRGRARTLNPNPSPNPSPNPNPNPNPIPDPNPGPDPHPDPNPDPDPGPHLFL